MPLLDWVNRNQAEETAPQVPYHLLKFEQVYGDEQQAKENLIIQGDNLHALKALLPIYGGKVKCIFIDPPYNTQTAFEHYDDKLEHAQWLSMMYPRLQLLKELLAEDGSIWITLDGSEVHYLKVLCDEVFGRPNYLGDLIWKKRKGGGNDSQFFAIDHDYILGYLKNSDKKYHAKKWRVPQSEEYLKRYKEIDENGNKYYWDTLARNGLKNPIPIELEAPDGSITTLNSQKGRDTIEIGLKRGHIKFTHTKNGWTLHHRVYMPEGQVLRSVLDQAGTNKDSSDEMEQIFGDKKAFDYPKPESLIASILNLATNTDDLVLDSFLGSGTTASVAHKMQRRYIGIEMGEHVKTHVIPRLEKVIEGEQSGISKVVNWQGGGGFSFYTLGSPVFDDQGFLNDDMKFQDLASYVWWLETKSALNQTENFDSPFLGIYEGTAYYLLYNGILGDRRPNGGNVLTTSVLKYLNECHSHEGPRVVIGEASRLGESRLDTLNIAFKQIPYSLYGNTVR